MKRSIVVLSLLFLLSACALQSPIASAEKGSTFEKVEANQIYWKEP